MLDRAGGVAGLEAGRDAAGNVVLRAGGDGGGRPPLVLVAHLDHPAFAIDATEDGRALPSGAGCGRAWPGRLAAVVLPPGDPEPAGKGRLRVAKEADGRLRGGTALVDDGEAPEGGFAVWGFPGAGAPKTIEAPACDDLLGVAAVVAALESAAEGGDGPPVMGLLTRAEEVGLLGAIEAARLGTVPEGALVLSLECSKALAGSPQGGGVVIRVGDRASIFDPALTAALVERAGAVEGSAGSASSWTGDVRGQRLRAAGWRTSGWPCPGQLQRRRRRLGRGPGVGPDRGLPRPGAAARGPGGRPLELQEGRPAWLERGPRARRR